MGLTCADQNLGSRPFSASSVMDLILEAMAESRAASVIGSFMSVSTRSVTSSMRRRNVTRRLLLGSSSARVIAQNPSFR